MNNLNFNVYVGGKGTTVDRTGLAQVPTPDPVGRWHPIPHMTLVEELEKALVPHNMRVVNETFKLDKGGQRVFGMMQIQNSVDMPDFSFVAGIRNAHDRMLKAGLVVGEGVFVCSNLRFTGEIVVGRKHTTEIMADLPSLMVEAVGRLHEKWDKQVSLIEKYKSIEVTRNQAYDLLIQMAKAEVFPRTQFMDVLHEWEEPQHEEFKPRTMWSLMNGVTESLKPRESSHGSTTWLLPQRTIKLTDICHQFAGISLQSPDVEPLTV